MSNMPQDSGTSYAGEGRDRDRDRDGREGRDGRDGPKQKFVIDYKNIEDLRRMMSGNGKIVSRKRAGATAKEQKRIAQAIKRARFMALLPYTNAMG